MVQGIIKSLRLTAWDAALMQDPLTLLLLGPTAKGMPGLLGVATLPLHIEDTPTDFSHNCSSRARPLPLISPAGERIGCITAAARVVCCQPAAPGQMKSQASQDSVSSTTARVPSYSSATPAVVQEPGHHALVSAVSVPAEQPAALLRTVSAAVQTDAPQDTSLASSQPLQEAVQRPLEPPQQLVQQEAGPAASGEGVSNDAQLCPAPDFQYVVQSPHFHIYPPGPHTAPAAPPQQCATQLPAVINISQPTFNFAAPEVQAALQAEPWPQTLSQTNAVLAAVTGDTKQRLQEAQPAVAQGSTAGADDIQQKLQPATLQGSTAVAHDIQQTLQQLQAAVEQMAAPSETGQGAQMVKAVDDFESWRPVTSVPLNNGTLVVADSHGLGIGGTAAEANAESVMTGQFCSGGHALVFRQPKPCNHQVLCRCHACAVYTVPDCLCPREAYAEARRNAQVTQV